jgi:hypothetical protein
MRLAICRIEADLNNLNHDESLSGNTSPYFNILADAEK